MSYSYVVYYEYRFAQLTIDVRTTTDRAENTNDERAFAPRDWRITPTRRLVAREELKGFIDTRVG